MVRPCAPSPLPISGGPPRRADQKRIARARSSAVARRRRRGNNRTQGKAPAVIVDFVFFNAWPSKWDGPALAAAANDVAIESLTIVCEQVELA
jgi:phage tail-like protein